MKRTVDLTSDRLFSTGWGSSRIPFVFRPSFSRVPWDFESLEEVRSDEDLYTFPELVRCGNATERARRLLGSRWCAGDFCDCCGKELSILPWRRVYCLCLECAALLPSRGQRLWRFMDDTIETSQDRVVIEMNRR